MKKFIALSVVLGVLAGTAFAEVTVTGGVDTVVMPLQVTVPDEGDTEFGAGVGRNNSNDATRAQIGISASNDTKQVGLNFKILFNPNAGGRNAELGIDDFAEVWWQPISQLKIEAGKFVNDTLRGKIGDDNWNRYTVGMKNGDGIFSRFKTTWASESNVGFMLGITPIEPLYIGVSVPSVLQIKAGADSVIKYTYREFKDNVWSEKTEGNAAHVYEKIQAGAGFTIGNIGLIRAQYVGSSHIYSASNWVDKGLQPAAWADNLNSRRIEAAFAYTGMEGLVVDVGGKVPLPFKTYEITNYSNSYLVDVSHNYNGPVTINEITQEGIVSWTEQETRTETIARVKVIDGAVTYQAPYQVSLGAGYTAGALDVKGRVDAQFAGKAEGGGYEYNKGLDINVHLWPSYNLGFATAGLDVGFNFIGDSTEKKTTDLEEQDVKGGYRFGVGAWLRKAYGAASIKGGLGLRLGEDNGDKLETVISVPIIFDYSF